MTSEKQGTYVPTLSLPPFLLSNLFGDLLDHFLLSRLLLRIWSEFQRLGWCFRRSFLWWDDVWTTHDDQLFLEVVEHLVDDGEARFGQGTVYLAVVCESAANCANLS